MKRFLPLALLCLAPFAPVRAAAANDAALPRPAELEPDVQFWIRVYSEVSTNEGFIHDQHKLSVVYETVHFDADMPPRERAHRVDAERSRIQEILRHLATGAVPQNAEEQHVRDLWGAQVTPARFAEAAEDVRFQLGQSDRFRAGLQRAAAWETHIAEVLANLGLPAQIAALPHVESSFDPTAYSKVGAAGLWQFMRSTGRRFLRIDAAVDERLDPFRATEAAAQLLSYNYRLLGTWPLAITAYNHGAEGVRRAREQLGTDDIVRIVREYRSPSFGFASRNFYVSFLAALSIAQEPEKYFGPLERRPESQFHELKLTAPANTEALLRTLGIDRATLRGLNPALRPGIWSGQRSIPPGYILRLPNSAEKWSAEALAQRLGGPRPVVVAQLAPARAGASVHSAPQSAAVATASPQSQAEIVPAPPSPLSADSINAAASPYYLVQEADTLASISARTGVPADKLMALNSLPDSDYLSDGQRLRLAAAVPEPETVTTAANLQTAQAAVVESVEEQRAVAAASQSAERAEPVSAAQAQAEGPELVPDPAGTGSADPVDYSIKPDGSIVVVAAETLGHYADWLGVPAARLRTLNSLRGHATVNMGRHVKLEFSHATRAQFEQRRRDYHERLQAAYFSSHRIAGTEIYIARRGDSLWSITQRNVKLPIWLLQQYNPDLDFSDLRPGTQISLPKVEDVPSL
ncbi:MAG: transglycosylase SLT domain-containing protein [Steroidobacteraceae bacterium]|jgi:membrane-bound lytic murein transglycosylase D